MKTQEAAERRGGGTEAAYRALKEMAIRYELKPGERINEGEIAEKLNLSRTPVREALNRLIVENLIVSVPNKGFVARSLDLNQIMELYEVRTAVETAAFRLSCQRATDEEIAALRASWTGTTGDDYSNMTLEEICDADEAFHRGLASLARNSELVRILDRVISQIRFCRMIDLEFNWRHKVLYREHIKMLDHLARRDVEAGVAEISDHILFSREQGMGVIKEGLARIYMPKQE